MLITLALVGYWVLIEWPKFRAFRASRAALRYAPADGHVAFDDDPAIYPKLLAGGGYVSSDRFLPGGLYALFNNTTFAKHQTLGF